MYRGSHQVIQWTGYPAAPENSPPSTSPHVEFPADRDTTHYFQGIHTAHALLQTPEFSPSSLSSPVPLSSSPAPSNGAAEHIPRPPNAFMLFRSDFLKQNVIPAYVEKRQQTLSRVAGEVWNLMPPEEKQKWHDRAAEVSKQHNERYPNYRFTAARRGGTRKGKSKSAEEVRAPDKDRIHELRETYLDVRGPALPSSRRRKNKNQTPASAGTSWSDSVIRQPSMERSLSRPNEAALHAVYPRPTYPHLVANHVFPEGNTKKC